MRPTRSRTRTVAFLATAALLLVSAVACGDGNPSKAAPAADPGIDKVAFADRLVSAVKEQGSARAELTFGTGVSATAVFRYGSGGEPAARISAELLGQRIEAVSLDGFFYLKKNAEAKFVRLTRDDPALSLFGGLTDLDPEQALTGMVERIRTIRDLGPETVDGQELTRYEVTLDAEALGSGMLGTIPGVDPAEDIAVTLYVDAQDLVHRAEADLGDNEVVLRLTAWGEPVTITAPPAGEILQN